MRSLYMTLVFLLFSNAAIAADLVFRSDETLLAVSPANVEAVVMHGQPSLQFRLTDTDSVAFENLTGDNIGNVLVVSLCDRVLVEAVVQERLSGVGILNVSSIEASLAASEVLRGEKSCSALDPHFDE